MSLDIVLEGKGQKSINREQLLSLLVQLYPSMDNADPEWWIVETGEVSFEVSADDDAFIMFYLHEISDEKFNALFSLLAQKLDCNILNTTTGNYLWENS